MTQHKYSYQKYNPDAMSRAVGRDLSISTKHCIEICNYLRGRKLESAKTILRGVINKSKPLPFKRFNDDVGHKKGDFSSARYPVKAASAVLKLVESCESNAQNKALNTSEMVLVHMNANKGSQQFRHGRHRRRLMKRTHVEVVLEEVSGKKSKGKTSTDTADKKGKTTGTDKKPSVAPEKAKAEAPLKKDTSKSEEQSKEGSSQESPANKTTTKKAVKKTSAKKTTKKSSNKRPQAKNKSDGEK
ncbi:MAG: 50S ribosomal protein L22 [Nanobdellota archaeon]